MGNLKFSPVNTDKPKGDPIRYPEVQVKYEQEFKENYSKMLKAIKVGILTELIKIK